MPRELRDRIYEFAVRHPKREPILIGIDYFAAAWTFNMIWSSGTHQPNITKVCRQLRSEALPLYYQLNEFAVSLEEPTDELDGDFGEAYFARWLKSIGPRNFMYIRKLTVFRMRNGLRYTYSTTLQQFLERYGIELSEDVWVRVVV